MLQHKVMFYWWWYLRTRVDERAKNFPGTLLEMLPVFESRPWVYPFPSPPLLEAAQGIKLLSSWDWVTSWEWLMVKVGYLFYMRTVVEARGILKQTVSLALWVVLVSVFLWHSGKCVRLYRGGATGPYTVSGIGTSSTSSKASALALALSVQTQRIAFRHLHTLQREIILFQGEPLTVKG